jgi:ankyrin repeat protein
MKVTLTRPVIVSLVLSMVRISMLIGLFVSSFSKGANANCVNKDGLPVLHVAVINKHVEAIRTLVQEGAKVNAKGPQHGYTALHQAVTLGHAGCKVIDALLR